MEIVDLVKKMRRPEVTELTLNQDEFEDTEDKWSEFLKERYGENDIRSMPCCREGINEIHFLVKGKPVIKES